MNERMAHLYGNAVINMPGSVLNAVGTGTGMALCSMARWGGLRGLPPAADSSAQCAPTVYGRLDKGSRQRLSDDEPSLPIHSEWMLVHVYAGTGTGTGMRLRDRLACVGHGKSIDVSRARFAF